MEIKLNAGNADIVYEVSDLGHGKGLILFHNKGEFQLHIFDDLDNTLARIDLSKGDIIRLVNSLYSFVADDDDTY